mgnify:CR=1 FL=1|tara:strand:+ start:1833 stop:2351 length:519 start_codon:yes stop_codon:yes gene_type:complete
MGKNIKRVAIFLDRDGTINYDYGYVHKFSDFKFRPYIIKGLRYLSKKNYLIFIVTNQAGIAKGIFKVSDLIKLNKKLIKYLLKRKIFIESIEYCPFHPLAKIKKYKKTSGYRKPGNLMIKKILKKWNINLKKSFMIGDHFTDKIAAKKSRLYFEYVKKNFYKQVINIERKIS